MPEESLAIWETLGTILAIVVPLAGLIVLMWNKIDNSINALKSDFRADINRLESKINSDINRLDDRVHEQIFALTNRVNMLFDRGASSGSDAGMPASPSGNVLASSSSPVSLTERGQEVAAEINAQAIVDKYAEKVIISEDADKLNIHNTCFRFAYTQMEHLVNHDEKRLINDAIYELDPANPHAVYKIFGVLLRDYHLRKRGFEVPKRKTGEGQQSPSPSPSQTSP